jgi:hypothetical protein
MVKVKKLKDGSRQVILTGKQFEEITKILSELAARADNTAVLISSVFPR